LAFLRFHSLPKKRDSILGQASIRWPTIREIGFEILIPTNNLNADLNGTILLRDNCTGTRDHSVRVVSSCQAPSEVSSAHYDQMAQWKNAKIPTRGEFHRTRQEPRNNLKYITTSYYNA